MTLLTRVSLFYALLCYDSRSTERYLLEIIYKYDEIQKI